MTCALALLGAISVLAACAGPRLPPRKSALAEYDTRDHAVHVVVSGLQPASDVALIGFGFTGGCPPIGSGIGFGMPVGGPTVAVPDSK
jgi:hypothetical protein